MSMGIPRLRRSDLSRSNWARAASPSSLYWFNNSARICLSVSGCERTDSSANRFSIRSAALILVFELTDAAFGFLVTGIPTVLSELCATGDVGPIMHLSMRRGLSLVCPSCPVQFG